MRKRKEATGHIPHLGLLAAALILLAPMMLSSGVASADLLRSGTTVLVSTFPDGTPADGGEPAVSDDGRYVAFSSWDALTSDSRGCQDVFRKDMTSGVTIRVSVGVPCSNFEPSISGDGNKVAFLSGFCANDRLILNYCSGYRAYVRDVAAQTTTLVSDTRWLALYTKISRDGNHALVINDDGWCCQDLMVTDIRTGNWRAIAGVCHCIIDLTADISGEGRYVVFESEEEHVPQDTDDNFDVYLYDRDTDDDGTFDETGATSISLVGITPSGEYRISRHPVISDDGTVVIFEGADVTADPVVNPVFGGSIWVSGSVFSRHIPTSTTTRISQNSWGAPASMEVSGRRHAVSQDGNRVAFTTWDPHMSTDANPGEDVFVRDSVAQKTDLASVLPDGTQPIATNWLPSISSDGRFVAFENRLHYELANERRVYLRDLLTPCPLLVCPLDL